MRGGGGALVLAGDQLRVHRDRALDQRERHRAQLVVLHDRADPADRAAVAQHRVAGRAGGARRRRRGAAAPAAAAGGPGWPPGRPSPARGSSPWSGAPPSRSSRPRAGSCGRRCRAAAGGAAPRRAAPRTPCVPAGRAPAAVSRCHQASSWRRGGPAGRRRRRRASRMRRTKPPSGSASAPCGRAGDRHAGRGQHVGGVRADDAQHGELGGGVARLDLGPEHHLVQVAQQLGHVARLGVEVDGVADVRDDHVVQHPAVGSSTSASVPVSAGSSLTCWVSSRCSQLSRSAPGTAITPRWLRSTTARRAGHRPLLGQRVAAVRGDAGVRVLQASGTVSVGRGHRSSASRRGSRGSARTARRG